MRTAFVAIVVVTCVFAAAVEACDMVDAGWDGSQVWWQIEGDKDESYYQWVDRWNADRNEWERQSEGQGRMLADGVQTETLSVSGQGKVRITVQGDNKTVREVAYGKAEATGGEWRRRAGVH